MDDVVIEQITIKTKDGQEVNCLCFDLPEIKYDGIILITAGIAIKQHFYRKLAQYLAEQNFMVYTMDYPGMGLSLSGSLRKVQANLGSWKDDIEDVIDWIKENHPDQPIFYLAHSLGGQLFGLLKNNHYVRAMIVVTSQNGYWRFYRSNKPAYFLFWYVYVPLITRIVGYFPSKWIQFGESVPKNAMLQWKKWCTDKDYLFSDPSIIEDPSTYRYNGPILSFSFTDDPWATEEAVNDLLDRFVGANVEHRSINPKQIGLNSIGHLGFFKDKSLKLWEESLDWLRNTSP
ncbi:MAG: alpha/beta hydrolase family protein [Candidatus Kariarchaeaceae archaeon]